MEIILLCTANVQDFVSIIKKKKSCNAYSKRKLHSLFQWNLNKKNEHEPNKHNYVNKSVSLLFYQSCISRSMYLIPH